MITSRKYVCRYENKCIISKGELESLEIVVKQPFIADVRCCCRACRFRKCQALGMQTEGKLNFTIVVLIMI